VISMLLVVIGYTHALIQYNVIVFGAILWSVLGAGWLLAGQKAKTPFKIPVLIWLAAYTLSVIFSIDPRRSAGQMLIMSTSLFLFYLVYDLVQRGWRKELFTGGLIFSASLVTLWGVIDAASWYNQWLTVNPGQLIPTFIYRPANSNVWAPFMYLNVILCLSKVLDSTTNKRRFLFLVPVFISTFTLYLTSSRAGYLGLALGLFVLGLWFVFQKKTQVLFIWKKIYSNKILMIILIIIAIGFSSLVGALVYKQSMHGSHGNIFTSRQTLWSTAINTFLAHPFFGQGPFTYGTAFMADYSIPPENIWAHAHSIPLNTLAETGLIGIGAVLFLAFSYIKQFVSTHKKNAVLLTSIEIAAFSFLAAFLMHSIFESLHMEPAVLWSLAILLALATKPSVGFSGYKHRPWWILLPILSAWLGVWGITPYFRGVQAANSNQWQLARTFFLDACKRDPYSALAHQQLALTDAILADNQYPEYLPEAIEHLKKTIEYEPSWALNHANLAALYYKNGQGEQALNAAMKAVELAPSVAVYHYLEGMIADEIDHTDLALQAYQQSMILDGTYQNASYWESSPIKSQAFTNWQSSLEPQPELTIEQIRDKYISNPEQIYLINAYAKALMQNNQIGSAQKILKNAQFAYTSRPSENIEAQWLKAELAALQGDFDTAIDLGQDALNKYNQTGVFGPGTFGLLYYAPRIFRMPAMAVEIVPQMVNLPSSKTWSERTLFFSEWNLMQK